MVLGIPILEHIRHHRKVLTCVLLLITAGLGKSCVHADTDVDMDTKEIKIVFTEFCTSELNTDNIFTHSPA